ncbi:hypothetical protein QQ045_019080 [Rhodiola kirilowii]
MMSNLPMWILAVALFAAGAVVTVDAQNVPSCASNLVPCFAYMNVTNPPESCCKPLKQTIDTQLECLCNLYNTPGLLPSFGVNVAEALTLPTRCGISGDLSACVTAQSPGSSTTPAVPPSEFGCTDLEEDCVNLGGRSSLENLYR